MKMDRSDDPYDFDDDFEEAARQYRHTSTPPASGSWQPQDLQPALLVLFRAIQMKLDIHLQQVFSLCLLTLVMHSRFFLA